MRSARQNAAPVPSLAPERREGGIWDSRAGTDEAEVSSGVSNMLESQPHIRIMVWLGVVPETDTIIGNPSDAA
jgi:hypothetical protein